MLRVTNAHDVTWPELGVRARARGIVLRAELRLRARELAVRLLARPLLLGLLGSLALAVGALGVGVLLATDPLTRPFVYGIRESVLGLAATTALALAGVALLLAAWLAVGRAVRAGTGPSVPRLQAMLAAWAAPLLLVPPLFSRDLYSYAAQAHLLRTGHNPYQVGPWVEPGAFADSVDPIWAATPSPYGPVFLWLGHQVSATAGESVYLTVLGMRLLAVAGVTLLAIYLPRLAARCGVDACGAVWLGLLNPLVLMHFVAGGHNDALMLGLVVAGVCLALEGHPAVGAVAVALAAGVKAPAALALAFVGHAWAAQRPGRSRLLTGLAGAGTVGLLTFTTVTHFTGLGYGWLSALGTPATVRTWLSPPTAIGMLAGLVGEGFGLGDHTYELVAQSRLVFGTLAVLAIAALSLRAGAMHPVRACALALLLIVALGPVVQPWYLMWGLALLAAAGVREREARLVGWGIVAVVVISQLNGSIMRGPILLPGALLCLWLTWVVVRHARERERVQHGEAAVFDLAAARALAHPRHDSSAGVLPAFVRALS